jgi:hypothetical protein
VKLRDACPASGSAGARASLAQAESLDQVLVALAVGVREVGQQAVAAADHEQQAAATVVVLGVGLEVLLQGADALAEIDMIPVLSSV